MADRPMMCIDRIAPQELLRPVRPRLTWDRLRAVSAFRKLWLNGSTLRVRFLDGTPAQQAQVKAQALSWTEHANLRFEFTDDLEAEIRIAFNPNEGAWSYVGTDCRTVPQDQPTMNLSCVGGGIAAHEFGHAIGLSHEHQNPIGGIMWNREAVIRDLSGPPNFWTVEQVDHYIFSTYSFDRIRGTTFDPDSIMLYFFPDHWVQDGKGAQANEVLSALDKVLIASAQAYPRTVVARPVELYVGDIASATAAIGAPGEEDVFTFTITTAGCYMIETTAQAEIVMKLFGPNSDTNLIGEDEGSVERNSHLIADLLPGTYLVQIRHFNEAGRTGSYSIKISR